MLRAGLYINFTKFDLMLRNRPKSFLNSDRKFKIRAHRRQLTWTTRARPTFDIFDHICGQNFMIIQIPGL